eukprot:TRINITY_DN11900_c0_g1_i1.p1 TRINITY_DN11900_c0_g1~~TRINITY_DN11900_c0_g1_i1.p1  ORF type:complete len:328 (-),score=43.85 TRINITY_DN11900_c0_g1_i1:118-1101(-)
MPFLRVSLKCSPTIQFMTRVTKPSQSSSLLESNIIQERMNISISICATIAATAAALCALNKFISDRILEEQYRQLRDIATKLSGSSKNPVTVAVFGLQNHGKSSFINTVHRVLYRENGPLIMRSETAPIKNTTKVSKTFTVKNRLTKYPKHLLAIIDTPGFPESDPISRSDVTPFLQGSKDAQNTNPSAVAVSEVECAVLLMKAKESPAVVERMQELAKVLRDQGLLFVVVITFKKEAKKSSINLKELTETVADKCGTDLVYCLDNYVVSHQDGKSGTSVRNNFETHSQTLNIVRQCFEFVKERRRATQKTETNQLASDQPLGYTSD